MSRSEQFEGKDLEEVLRRAAESAGCRREDLSFVVVREERGFLGAEGRSISVQVELPDRPLSTSSPSRPRERPSSAVPPAARARREPAAEQGTAGATADALGTDDAEAGVGHAEEEPSGPDPSAPQVLELVRELVSRMGLEVEATLSEADGRILVDLRGADRDLVLGEEGVTLDALQYLVNRIAERELGTVNRVQLESDGFRSEREDEVREMALAAAEKVRRSGAAVRLPPLNPYERRIVHVTLSDSPGVATESEGGGFVKRVVVLPLGRSANAAQHTPVDRGRGSDRRRGGRR